MTLTDLTPETPRFRTSEEVFDELEAACATNPDIAELEILGRSEEGRPIAGVTLGYGPHRMTLVAGAHADEPVGPETLRTLITDGLAARGWGAESGGLESLWEQVTLQIVPHVNPDGEARNQGWIQAWDESDLASSLRAYLQERRREPPGRDIEFGYPALRRENEAVSRFLFDGSPIALHASLHGMGFSEGALLLIDKTWIDRTKTVPLREGYELAAASVGLRLHDHDRGAEKGFRYAGPGFWTTPEGRAMRQHFLDLGDPETAGKFRLSSMEHAIETGSIASSTPLCVVTELPLFQLAAEYDHQPGVPDLLFQFRELQPELVAAAASGDALAPLVEPLGMQMVPLRDAIRVQLATLELAMEALRSGNDGQS
ncbi:MAG: M14 family zinc carboxypeptidase [Rubricoccaceae bacterium]